MVHAHTLFDMIMVQVLFFAWYNSIYLWRWKRDALHLIYHGFYNRQAMQDSIATPCKVLSFFSLLAFMIALVILILLNNRNFLFLLLILLALVWQWSTTESSCLVLIFFSLELKVRVPFPLSDTNIYCVNFVVFFLVDRWEILI